MIQRAGKTDRYAVIGFPVTHSRSPGIHRAFALQTDQNIEYERIEAVPAEFVSTAQRFFASGGKGLNVTLPHKRAAYELADELTPRAKRAGVVNTLAVLNGMLLGENTDGPGLVSDLKKNLQLNLKDRRLLLLGAGGACQGIAGPLLDEQPALLWIVNRDVKKAARVARRFIEQGPVRASGYTDVAGEQFDFVINTTSAGHQKVCPPLDAAVFTVTTVAYDLSYGDVAKPFCAWVKSLGVQVFDGLGLLVEQAADSFELWRGVRPKTARVLEKLRTGLL